MFVIWSREQSEACHFDQDQHRCHANAGAVVNGTIARVCGESLNA